MPHSHCFPPESGLSGLGGFTLTLSSLLLRGAVVSAVNTYTLIIFVLVTHAFEDNWSISHINYDVCVCMINFIRTGTCKEKLKEFFLAE